MEHFKGYTHASTTNNQSAESTGGLGLHIGGSRKVSSLSKHEVFEQLLQTLNDERM